MDSNHGRRSHFYETPPLYHSHHSWVKLTKVFSFQESKVKPEPGKSHSRSHGWAWPDVLKKIQTGNAAQPDFRFSGTNIRNRMKNLTLLWRQLCQTWRQYWRENQLKPKLLSDLIGCRCCYKEAFWLAKRWVKLHRYTIYWLLLS